MSQSAEFLKTQRSLVDLPQPVFRNSAFYQQAVRSAVNAGGPVAVKNTAAQYGVYAAVSGAGAHPFQLAPEPQATNMHICQHNMY